VNLGVSKDQRLSLNPSQISGACGRLMCCLRYEHEFYVQSRKRFPKEGKLIRTKRGEEKVLTNDIFRDRVTLRGEDGEVRTIELAELRNEAETVGAPLPISMTAIAADDSPSRGDDTEVALDEELIEETVVIPVITVSETAEIEIPAPEVVPQAQAADARERRPHRRRGRRGGRRNRQGGRPNAEGGDAADGGDAAEGGDAGDASDAGDSE